MAKTVKKFLSKLQVEDLDGNQWKLLAPLIYQGTTAPSGQAIKTRYIAPKGFVTDLASIPRFISGVRRVETTMRAQSCTTLRIVAILLLNLRMR